MNLVQNQTIVAIATPPGRGGVGIVRLSGTKALSIAKQVSQKDNIPVKQALYTSMIDEQSEQIDQGLLLYFKTPHSFTGEDVVEFHCHGSPVVLDRILKTCLYYGAIIAKPGEFSERAFLNQKIDLVQAESIADLINAHSQKAASMAIQSLQGVFSKKINQISHVLTELRIFVEAAIDFTDEDIDFLSEYAIQSRLDHLSIELDAILKEASSSALLREGISIVIAGAPNAGKSTLINTLSGKDVAIVTDIPGTTRDIMREYIHIDDLPVHILDTAGLRDSDDPIESEGIKRAWEHINKADLILFVYDVTEKNEKQRYQLLKQMPSNIPKLLLANKIDLQPQSDCYQDDIIYFSAHTGEGLSLLKQAIYKQVGYQPAEGLYLARRRHLEALKLAQQFLVAGRDNLIASRACDAVADDLRLAHQALSEITGEFTSDDLLGKIFSAFCIGK